MLSAVTLSLALVRGSTAVVSADTLPPAPLPADTVGARPTVGVPPTAGSGPVGPTPPERRATPAPADSGRVQPPVELSDWYYRRNTIHHVASYTMLPLFAAQYVSGRRVYADLANAPRWATRTHQVAATGVAALFVVNTVTGGWNLWEGRRVPEGRGRRLVHSALMLAADAGFTYTGLLAERAEEDYTGRDRRVHRTVALTSVGVAAAGYLVMLVGER